MIIDHDIYYMVKSNEKMLLLKLIEIISKVFDDC